MGEAGEGAPPPPGEGQELPATSSNPISDDIVEAADPTTGSDGEASETPEQPDVPDQDGGEPDEHASETHEEEEVAPLQELFDEPEEEVDAGVSDRLESGETRSIDSVDERYFSSVRLVAEALKSGDFNANDELKQGIIDSLAIIKQAEDTKALGDATLFNDTGRERHDLKPGEFVVVEEGKPTGEIKNMRDAVGPVWRGLEEIAKGDGENAQKAQALIKELGQYVKMNEDGEVIGFDRIAKEWDDFGDELRRLQEGTIDKGKLEECFHGVRDMWIALLARDEQVKMKWLKENLLPKRFNLREKTTTGQVFTDRKTRKMVVELLGDFLVADATENPQIKMLNQSSALKQSGFMFNKLHHVIGNHVSHEDYRALDSSTQMLQNLDTAIRQARIPERLTQLLENYAPDVDLQRWKQLVETGNIGQLRPELEQVADDNPTIRNWLEKVSAVDGKAIEDQLNDFVNDEHKKIMEEIWKKRRKSLLLSLFITAMVGAPVMISTAQEGEGGAGRGH